MRERGNMYSLSVCKLVQTLWKLVWRFFKKTRYRSAICENQLLDNDLLTYLVIYTNHFLYCLFQSKSSFTTWNWMTCRNSWNTETLPLTAWPISICWSSYFLILRYKMKIQIGPNTKAFWELSWLWSAADISSLLLSMVSESLFQKDSWNSWSSYITLGHNFKGLYILVQVYLFIHVCFCAIHNGQEMETT